jgi:small subunit ribosomal protein S15
MIDKKKKKQIINKFKTHANDTGSTPVQIAILSEEINQLAEHLKMHKQDHSSRRGLLKKVNERRKLLKYLQKEDETLFADVAKRLKLKIAKKLIEEEEEKKRLEALLNKEPEDENDDEDENKDEEKKEDKEKKD